MAGLFVSGHHTSMQGAGMKALKISSAEPLKSRRSTALSSSHSSRGCSSIPRGSAGSQSQAAPWPGREPRGSWAGVSILPTCQQSPSARSTREMKLLLLLPLLSWVRIVLRSAAVGEAVLPPAKGSVYISAAVRSPKCSPAVKSQNELQTVWTKLSSHICASNPIQ